MNIEDKSQLRTILGSVQPHNTNHKRRLKIKFIYVGTGIEYVSDNLKLWTMQPMVTDRRHFFLLEGCNVPLELIVEHICENGYTKVQSDENHGITNLVKSDGIVSLYAIQESGVYRQVGGTITPNTRKLEQARKVQRVITILGISFILYCIFALALYILPIVASLIGWLDFIELVSPITPFLGIGFFAFLAILLFPISYSYWFLPIQNRNVAQDILEEIVPIVKETCPGLDFHSTEIERQNWPDFGISHGIPEEMQLRIQTIENSFPEFGTLETQIDSMKTPL